MVFYAYHHKINTLELKSKKTSGEIHFIFADISMYIDNAIFNLM